MCLRAKVDVPMSLRLGTVTWRTNDVSNGGTNAGRSYGSAWIMHAIISTVVVCT